MTIDDYAQIQAINEQLDHMKELGLIDEYSFDIGDTLETSNIKLKVSEEMIQHVFKNQPATVH